jgi:hypothetical protein
MLLLCCCLRDRQSRKDVRSADGGEEMVQHRKGPSAHHNQHIDVSKQELKELERPSEINMKLEVSINLWEQAIHEYDELESHLLDSGDAELKAVLPTLRNQPVPYLNSKNEKVRSLAVKRNEVFVREKAICLQVSEWNCVHFVRGVDKEDVASWAFSYDGRPLFVTSQAMG